MKEAINIVGDEYELPNGWLNSDFMRTASYSDKLREISQYYKTYSNILEVRTVPAQYLIAMKLCSGRKYKNDLSDIVGILDEHKKKGCPITLEEIIHAIEILYDDSEKISKVSLDFIYRVFEYKNFEDLYRETCNEEEISKISLVEFEQEYPNSLNHNNVDDILAMLKNKK